MLAELLGDKIFAVLLVFLRVGAAVMVLPGFGASFVSATVRLALALLISLVMAQALSPHLPEAPGNIPGLVVLIVWEIVIGVFMGTVTRLVFSALTAAGALIAQAMGLSNASIFDPAQATQETLPGALFSNLAVTMMFATDMHHQILRGIAGSYDRFPAGTAPPIGDFANAVEIVVSQAFALGLQIAAPFVVVGLMSSLALGLAGRVMPQLQIFYLMMPVQVILGLLIFALVLSAMMGGWLQALDASLHNLYLPG